MKDYKELVDRLREVAYGEHISRRQLLLSAAGAIESLQFELTNEETLLAFAAGARAIENDRRLVGASYAFNLMGMHGGPKLISYYAAAQRLHYLSEPLMEGGKDG